jgi:hypothetical protein
VTEETVFYVVGTIIMLAVALGMVAVVAIGAIGSLALFFDVGPMARKATTPSVHPRGAPAWRIALPDGEHRVWLRGSGVAHVVSVDDVWVSLDWERVSWRGPRCADFRIAGRMARLVERPIWRAGGWRAVRLLATDQSLVYDLTVDGGDVESTADSATAS